MKSKTIVITGASRGIGRAMMEAFSKEGHKLFLFVRHEKGETYPPNCEVVICDLSVSEEINQAVTKIAKKSDGIDILINNAGIYLEKPFEDHSEKEIKQMMDINFSGPTQLIKLLLPELKKSPYPLIINIGSSSALSSPRGQSLYAASKSALRTLSNVLRKELNPHGIRLCSIHPSSVNTWNDPHPEKHLAPNDIAQLVRFICSLEGKIQIDELSISTV